MPKDLRKRIEKGIYQLIASLCLMILILIITSGLSDDLVKAIRFTLAVIFLFLAYKLYLWLTREE